MSDHLSSPRALDDPASDICDLFVFPSPERPGRLVFAMTLYPRAPAGTAFDDDVVAVFRLRPVSIARRGPGARFDVANASQQIVFDCAFSPSAPGGEQTVTCTTPSHHRVTAAVGDRNGGRADGLAVFAGLVSDPFIFQLESIFQTLTTGRLAFGQVTTGTMEGADCLGIVVEVDCARWLPGGPLFALVGETYTAGRRPVRLERVGRPEIKNIGLQWNGNDTVNRDIDVRDLYNAEDAFAVREGYRRAYAARLSSNLVFYDGLDGKTDWPLTDDGRHPLVDLLLDDYLVVDVSKPFNEDTWLTIERSMLADRPHTSCGGRWINDDFLDSYYTLFINAGNGPRIGDGVDHATVAAEKQFPYLAPANSTFLTAGAPR